MPNSKSIVPALDLALDLLGNGVADASTIYTSMADAAQTMEKGYALEQHLFAMGYILCLRDLQRLSCGECGLMIDRCLCPKN